MINDIGAERGVRRIIYSYLSHESLRRQTSFVGTAALHKASAVSLGVAERRFATQLFFLLLDIIADTAPVYKIFPP
jgi:hypothetical protein